MKWMVSLSRKALHLVVTLRRKRISIILSSIVDKTWHSTKVLSKRRQRASSINWLSASHPRINIPPDRMATRTPRKGGVPDRRGRRSLATLSRQVALARKGARWRVLVVLKVGRMRHRDRTHGRSTRRCEWARIDQVRSSPRQGPDLPVALTVWAVFASVAKQHPIVQRLSKGVHDKAVVVLLRLRRGQHRRACDGRPSDERE